MKKSKNGKPWIISLDRDAFTQALFLVGAAINRRSILPILQYVLCRVENKILTLTGTDLDVRVSHRVKCDSPNGEFTLPWGGLGKDVKGLQPGSIVIEVLSKDKVAIFDRSTILQYETLPPADFPVLDDKATATAAYVVVADKLKALIDNVKHAVSDDASRYYLNGAFFHCVDKGVLRVVTTDGHRMVVDQIEAENITTEAPKVIVPMLTLKAVIKHCVEAPSAAVEIASYGNGSIGFDFGLGRVIVSKTIDGTFPEYTRVIPTTNDKVVLLDTDELDQALAKFPAGVKRQAMGGVKLTFKKNNLTLSREPRDGKPGISLKVRCEWKEADFSIGFNPAYLRDAISVLGDTVGIAFGDPGTPALLMSGEYPQITLMPMRA